MFSIYREKRLLIYSPFCVGLIFCFSLAADSAALTLGNSTFVRQARVLEIDRAGFKNPGGLAFSPAANAFYVVEKLRLGQAPPVQTVVRTVSI